MNTNLPLRVVLIFLLSIATSCMPTSVPSGSKEEPWVGLWTTNPEEDSGISTHYLVQLWYEKNQLNGKLWRISKVTNVALRGGIELAGGDGKNMEMYLLRSLRIEDIEAGRKQLSVMISKEKFLGGVGEDCGDLKVVLGEDSINFRGPLNFKGLTSKELHFIKRKNDPNNPNPYM